MSKGNTLWSILIVLMACAGAETNRDTENQAHFDHPQDLQFLDNQLMVLSTGYDPIRWNEGFLSVFDAETYRLKSQIQTYALNPTKILPHQDGLIVLETGAYDFSDFDNPVSLKPFGLEILGKSNNSYSHHAFIQLPELLNGHSLSAPTDIRTIGAVTLVASGLKNILWKITWQPNDLFEPQSIEIIKLEAQIKSGLSTITTWNDIFLVTEFNTDKLYLLDQQGEKIDCDVELGLYETEMEGIQTPVVVEDELFVSFAFSGHLERVYLPALIQECELQKSSLPTPVGQMPNAIELVGDQLWVTMSGENHILKIQRETGREAGKIVLPISSNPWRFVFHEASRVGAVSLWGLNDVYLLKETGELQGSLNDEINENPDQD